MTLTDGFQPEGVTKMFQDSVFMMPHLGLLSTVYPEAAWSVFDKDCLIRLGTVIAPSGKIDEGKRGIDLTLDMPDGTTVNEQLRGGEIKKISLPGGQKAKALIKPHGALDVGAGEGKTLETTIDGGIVGIVIDVRGRPIRLPEEEQERKEKLIGWYKSLELYPTFLFE